MNSPRDLDLEEGGETPEDLPLAGRVVRQGGMVGWAHTHHSPDRQMRGSSKGGSLEWSPARPLLEILGSLHSKHFQYRIYRHAHKGTLKY